MQQYVIGNKTTLKFMLSVVKWKNLNASSLLTRESETGSGKSREPDERVQYAAANEENVFYVNSSIQFFNWHFYGRIK